MLIELASYIVETLSIANNHSWWFSWAPGPVEVVTGPAKPFDKAFANKSF